MSYKAILDAARMVRQYIESEGDFVYTNKLNMASTLDSAKSSGNHRINCVRGIYWALRITGDLPAPYWFYCSMGKIKWGEGAKKILKSKGWQIIDGKGKSVVKAVNDKTLLPGDIVGYTNMTHTNLYAGGGKWYDFGHGYSKTSGELAKIKKVYGKTIYTDAKISYIIRKVIYRVQIGAFSTASAMGQAAALVKLKTGYDCFTEKGSDGLTHLYCGSYKAKANAEKRVEELKAIGVKAIIKKM